MGHHQSLRHALRKKRKEKEKSKNYDPKVIKVTKRKEI